MRPNLDGEGAHAPVSSSLDLAGAGSDPGTPGWLPTPKWEVGSGVLAPAGCMAVHGRLCRLIVVHGGPVVVWYMLRRLRLVRLTIAGGWCRSPPTF
jgi:hypothetical protein